MSERLNIGVVDYGLGNVASVRQAFERLGCRTLLSADASKLSHADAWVLPGVGAFPAAMEALAQSGLDETIRGFANEGQKPLLGICLGMQILAEWGEEFGEHRGLGLIPGRVRKLAAGAGRKVPHVGWSEVCLQQAGRVLFARQKAGDAYFFDHSYYFDADETMRAASVSWDGEVVAAVSRGHVYGVQFHPEKSQNAGLRVLNAFALEALALRRKREVTENV